ncbi:MAG: hypothetical protein DDT18_00970 [Actinobacteria bacterium]|nr:hypothetical protein [Actinomycetota bacterium]
MALGLKSRMDRQDRDINGLKQSVIYKDTFEQFEKRFDASVEKIDSIDRKLDTLLMRRRDDRGGKYEPSLD